jgi:hypothetical protein
MNQNAIRMTISRKMRFERRVACMGAKRSSHKILAAKSEGKSH